MKKFILGFLCCSVFIIVGACYSSLASLDTAKHNASNLTVQPSGSNQNEEKRSFSKENNPKYPLILLGSVDLREGKVEIIENQVWTDGRDGKDVQDAKETDFPQVANGDKIEVDIMNCAGFIAKGEVSKVAEDYGWKLKITPNSFSADASEKVRQCASPIYSAKEKFVTGAVFAIAPTNTNRQNIRTAKVDTKKLFLSLPKATQIWADDSERKTGKRKGNLTLEEDNWADTDGDGKIDLIVLFGRCENKEYSCGSLIMLLDGIWKEIGYITPA